MSDIDEEVLKQIEFHEKEALRLRKEAGMTVKIFTHRFHSVISNKLVFEGMRLEWEEADTQKPYRETLMVNSVDWVGDISNVFPSNKSEIYKNAGDFKDEYYEINCTFEKAAPVMRIGGYLDQRFF